MVLGMFAAHAQKVGEGKQFLNDDDVSFVQKLVPFYAKCLIEVMSFVNICPCVK